MREHVLSTENLAWASPNIPIRGFANTWQREGPAAASKRANLHEACPSDVSIQKRGQTALKSWSLQPALAQEFEASTPADIRHCTATENCTFPIQNACIAWPLLQVAVGSHTWLATPATLTAKTNQSVWWTQSVSFLLFARIRHVGQAIKLPVAVANVRFWGLAQ